MEQEISIAVVGSEQSKESLRATGCQLLPIPSTTQLADLKSNKALRLVVVEAGFVEHANVPQEVKTVRSSLPLTDVLVWAPRGTATLVRESFRAGARDVVVSKSSATLMDVVREILEEQQILPKVHQLAQQRTRSARFESMLSRSDAMWDVFEQCSRVAPADATVLIIGETGTGKELLARAIHRRSGRKGRFVACNCGSISEQLIESELFGHQKGAFTGAVREKKGLVRHAHEGTLFLDEIGDMPENVQVNLLRLLQEKKVRPVGSNEEVTVDVRIVAATHVPLDDAVAEGRFREDLFYRLDVIRLSLPPLRDRPEDIVFLFGFFLKKLKSHYGTEAPEMSDGFLSALATFDWPGNVRQLENFAERMMLTAPRRKLTARDFRRTLESGLEAEPARPRPDDSRAPAVDIDPRRTLAANLAPIVDQVERRYFDALLRANRGKIAATAEQAGISRRTLLRKLNALQLDKADYRRS